MPLTTNSSAIYVHFVTDDSVSSYGFRLEYITFGAYPGYHVDVTFCKKTSNGQVQVEGENALIRIFQHMA